MAEVGEAVLRAVEWIKGKPKARANRPNASSSYEAKHVMEEEIGLYVSDEEFRQACKLANVELHWPQGSSYSESPWVGLKL